MLANWTKILPFFIVAWLARKHCMRLNWPCENSNIVYAEAYSDTLIQIKE